MKADVRALRHPHAVEQENAGAALLLLGCVAATLVFPGILIGAAVAAAVWHATRPHIAFRWMSAVAGAAATVTAHAALLPLWPWRLLFGSAIGLAPLSLGPSTVGSVAMETLSGPLVLLFLGLARSIRRRHLMPRLRSEEVERMRQRTRLARPVAPLVDTDHPSGLIRLGVDANTSQPFDLRPEELAQHVFVPGAPGSGKTTTIARVADGALAVGYSVAIIDCKGSGLAAMARRLANRRGASFSLFDPDAEESLGYDACTGDASGIANKLLGAFTFGGSAEIYKQAGMEAIPIVVRALRAAEEPVTLDAIYGAFTKGGLAALGRRAGSPHKERLTVLEQSGQLGSLAYSGLQRRLGALLEGKFGVLLRQRPAIDWDAALDGGGVTYAALSATASSEDVELLARVIIQDLKQVCSRRLRALDRGEDLRPALIVFDEFAALREAEQIVDLLLQARQARMPVVVATQYIPEAIPVRQACLGAGLIIAHRVVAADSEDISAQFGTESIFDLTVQTPIDGSAPQVGSARRVEQYVMHPNRLREMPVGRAAVRAAATGRRTLVQVHRDPAFDSVAKADDPP